MCFINEIFEIIYLFLYNKLKDLTLLTFYLNYFNFILSKSLFFRKINRFKSFYENKLLRIY